MVEHWLERLWQMVSKPLEAKGNDRPVSASVFELLDETIDGFCVIQFRHIVG